ncbi:MAG: zinc ribbon domain-containing protein [Gemmatimonadaceae bacterium]|nr:zinc ribbon domain-containing protein [Gemmatimonadaceae bacterium]
MSTPNSSGAISPSDPSPRGGFCAACGTALSPNARFCHRCGTPEGEGLPFELSASPSPTVGGGSLLPWGIAAISLLALVAMYVGQRYGARGADGSAVAGTPTTTDAPAAPFAGGASGPAPNIANMSPSERASRLYVRVMEYAEAGKVDSVATFAPMVLAAHEMLEQPTMDERYHFGRVAEVVGAANVAKAQADTILSAQPRNLLGLLLAARAARASNDLAAAKQFDQRLLAALTLELATRNEDYENHRAEIDRAVSEARQP